MDYKTKKQYVQDCGHGGSDNGATGVNGQKEKEWTLEAGFYVDTRLEELGIFSKMTRDKDVTLTNEQRTNYVSKFDRCISHHFNAFNGSAHGAETIHSIYTNGKFAQIIADKLEETGQNIRRVFDKKNSRGSDWYYMHRNTGSCETIIVEYFFLDNKDEYEEYKDKEKREELYEAVVEAICEYENVPYSPPKKENKKESNNVLYRVQVGAFGNKENAENLAKELKSKGYNAIIK